MLPIEKSEVLRYLGYRRKQELTKEVEQMVEEMMMEVQHICKPRYLFQAFDFTIDEEKKEVLVTGTTLVLKGKNIVAHLKEAKKLVLLAATLGIEAERATRLYEITDMTKAYIFDACTVDYIEKICDLAEVEMDEFAYPEWTLNRRFSPGYGDLPLDVQSSFLKTLEADKKLGLTLTATNLMVPRKSVTAIIGLFEDEKNARPRRKAPEKLTKETVQAHPWNVEGKR